MTNWLPWRAYKGLIENKFSGYSAQEIYKFIIESNYEITSKDGTTYNVSLQKLEETLGVPYIRSSAKTIEW